MGFDVDERFMTTGIMDEAIERAAKGAQIEFVTVTNKFREKCRNKTPLFFRYDGHMNAYGNRLYAEQLVPIVSQYLSTFPKVPDILATS